MEEKLKKWQVIYIDNVKYLVMSMIEFEENSDIWQEYEIRDELGKSKILCIEKNESNKILYSTYIPYTGDINEKDKNFSINGHEYEFLDEGVATVKNYLGNVDVDIREQCKYINFHIIKYFKFLAGKNLFKKMIKEIIIFHLPLMGYIIFKK